MRKLVRFEGEFWFIDLSTDDWVFDRVTKEGKREPAGSTVQWGYFMEILESGPCVANPPPNPSAEWFINFFKTNNI